MLSVLYQFCLLLGLITACVGALGSKKWFWLSGLLFYILSFLGSFSIGGLTLSLTFVLWALALGYSLKLIKKPAHILLAILTGIALWALMVTTLDDAWWYLPFRVLL